MGRVPTKSMEGKNTPIDIKATQTMQIWNKLVNNIKQKSLCRRREVEVRGSNEANTSFLETLIIVTSSIINFLKI